MGFMFMHGDGGGGGGAAAAAEYFPPSRICDYCESAAALLFCRADSAFLCIACDSKLHVSHTNKHERVWMCEVCEQAPAVFACKADAAVLCSDCDRDIHSANPLARRHDRTPVAPFYENAESVVLKSAATPPLVLIHDSDSVVEQAADLFNDSSSSWIPTKIPDAKSIEFLLSDSDQLLDFEISQQISSQLFSDCVVPVQTTTKPPAPPPQALTQQNYSSENRFEIDFTTSNINPYNNSYTATPSLSHSFSSSSMDLGVVPDGSSMSDISYPFPSSNVDSAVDVGGNQGFPVSGLDREARVLRYREKRKNRRFQKTIRYASRKAYAETRPRIKGRFAKRTDGELEGDSVFMPGSPDYVFDARYDVVLSF